VSYGVADLADSPTGSLTLWLVQFASQSHTSRALLAPMPTPIVISRVRGLRLYEGCVHHYYTCRRIAAEGRHTPACVAHYNLVAANGRDWTACRPMTLALLAVTSHYTTIPRRFMVVLQLMHAMCSISSSRCVRHHHDTCEPSLDARFHPRTRRRRASLMLLLEHNPSNQFTVGYTSCVTHELQAQIVRMAW